MKIALLFFLFLLLPELYGKVLFSDFDKQQRLETFSFKNVEVSTTICKKGGCLAKVAVQSTTKSILKKVYVGPGGVNPTSPFCRVLKGQVRIYYLPNQDAISICLFRDSSFLVTWDLFNKLTE